ncbi:hypothetical protein [Intrasporangium sp.]|uniref:hypothetical protein n=1 Tax=Intrasporangium sp. TaxID=1925024 RepID=UPI003365649C
MRPLSDYSFKFPAAGLSGYEGPNDSGEEHFTGRALSESVARECIQNSLDAGATDQDPVRVSFELRRVSTKEIPGIDGLREAMKAALLEAEGLQGQGRLQTALDAANASHLWVLRIADYGTRGLAGSERRRDQKSPLSILTRGHGASSSHGGRGGSFGIGSSVGPMAAEASTVFYRTIRRDDDHVVVAGVSRLASHYDADGEMRRREGYLTLSARDDDFEYPRDVPLLTNFAPRAEPGTDIFVLGYRDAARDPDLTMVRDAAVANFLVAIDRGHLVVEGSTPAGDWTLDASNIYSTLTSSESLSAAVLPFYRALKDETPVVKSFDGLGEVSLHIYEDDTLERSLGTWTMRKPLMKIDTFTHRIPCSYAAILICADQAINERLREIEPPEHNRWNEQGPRSDRALVQKLKGFVREELRARLHMSTSNATKISGLERFLPAVAGLSAAGVSHGRPTGGDPTSEESSSRVGRAVATYKVDPTSQRPFKVSVRQPAISSSDGQAGIKGKDVGGNGTARKSRGGDLDGSAEHGDGTSRLPAGSIKLRSFTPAEASHSVLILTPNVSAEGDLTLAPLGRTGSEEEHELRITRAHLIDGLELRPLEFADMTLKNLAVVEGVPNRIEVEFNTHRKYRLGVKHG